MTEWLANQSLPDPKEWSKDQTVYGCVYVTILWAVKEGKKLILGMASSCPLELSSLPASSSSSLCSSLHYWSCYCIYCILGSAATHTQYNISSLLLIIHPRPPRFPSMFREPAKYSSRETCTDSQDPKMCPKNFKHFDLPSSIPNIRSCSSRTRNPLPSFFLF